MSKNEMGHCGQRHDLNYLLAQVTGELILGSKVPKDKEFVGPVSDEEKEERYQVQDGQDTGVGHRNEHHREDLGKSQLKNKFRTGV